MIELTRKGDYAIRGLVYLAARPANQVCILSDIATAVNAPQAFLVKIFKEFNKTGLVRSFRGANGGYVLGRSPDTISLLQIVEAVEGPITPNRCVSGTCEYERGKDCNVRPVWVRVQSHVRELLQNISLKELSGHDDHMVATDSKQGRYTFDDVVNQNTKQRRDCGHHGRCEHTRT